MVARTVNCEPSVDALAEKIDRGRPLRVKLGVDPTAPDIHLGHCVVLGKLREFQDAGHTAVLVIGDWTARVGDPSGRSSTRPMLSEDEIVRKRRNLPEPGVPHPRSRAHRGPGQRRVVRAAWASPHCSSWPSRATINQLLRRNDFATRMHEDRPVSVLELLYPLLQAYDSVALEADVELGGTDQLFNLMLGREIQSRYGMPQQVVLTMPILPGTDGVQKMSKSLGNYIGVTETPEEQFGKIMSIPDGLMAEYYRLMFPGEPPPAGHPGDEKRRLGRLVVAALPRRRGGRCVPRSTSTGSFATGRLRPTCRSIVLADGEIHLPALLVDALGVASRSEARRLIQQGGVAPRWGADHARWTCLHLPCVGGILRAGKRRFVRLVLNGVERMPPDCP